MAIRRCYDTRGRFLWLQTAAVCFFIFYLFRSLLDTSHTQQLGISDKLESEGDVLCRRGKLQEMDLHAEQLRLFTESHGLNYLVLA